MRLRTFKTAIAGLALLALGAGSADAAEGIGALFLDDVRVLYAAPVGPPVALVGETPPARSFDYGTFAAELVAFVAKEVLDDSPDEFAGNSLLPSTLSPSMPATDDDFGDHCLKVVKDIGRGISSASDGPRISTIGSAAPSVATYAGRAIGAAFTIQEAWKLIRKDIVEHRSEGFSLRPKVGSNKIALSLTLRW